MHSLVRVTVLASVAWFAVARVDAVELSVLSAPEDTQIHGVRGNDSSYRCSVSADGQQVAFESFAFQLVPDDFNRSRDVFVRDRSNGATLRVSVDATGREVAADADHPAISGDGRYVAFSVAADLVGGSFTFFRQVYLYDRATATLTLVSRSTSGTVGNSSSDSPVISSNGTHVAFQSRATDLVAGDTNGVGDAYVYDIAAGTLVLASVNAAGVQGDQPVFGIDLSKDGGVLAFETASTTLDAADTNGTRDVYLKTLASGTLELASVDGSGVPGSTDVELQDLADDGQSVLFATDSALVAGDTNGLTDIYQRRVVAGTTLRVSDTLAGADGDDAADHARSSADGRRVVFASRASNLTGAVDGSVRRLYLRDLDAGTLALLPTGSLRSSTLHAMNPAGSVICFSNDGADVAASGAGADLNGVADVYLLHMGSGVVELVSRSQVAQPVGVGNGDSNHASISADGRYVVFDSHAADLDLEQDDMAGGRKLYLLDQDTGSIERVAVVPGGADRDRFDPEISADGRFIAFESYATNLVADDDLTGDVFRYDRDTGELLRLSEAVAGGAGHGSDPSISGDGARVVFVSDDVNGVLDPDDENDEDDVYLWEGGTLSRLSVAADGTSANGASRDPRISADGQWVVFESEADNLTGDRVAGTQALYLADLAAGTLACLTCGHDLTITAADLSADGSRVVFHVVPVGAGTAPFDTPGIYLHDRLAGTAEQLPIAYDFVDAYGVETRISGDGSTVVFSAGASVAGPSSKGLLSEEDVRLYRYRIDTGELSEPFADGVQGGTVNRVAIDASGRHLLAGASDPLLPLVDRNGHYDVYQASLAPGMVTLAAPSSVDENDGSVTLTLVRSDGSDGVLRASVVAADGSAQAGSDYLAPTGSVEWLDGETGAKQLVLALVDDAAVEADEQFTVAIGTLLGGADFDAGAVAVTVTDSDVVRGDPIFADGFESP